MLIPLEALAMSPPNPNKRKKKGLTYKLLASNHSNFAFTYSFVKHSKTFLKYIWRAFYI
jgi:hypothetical protein